MGLEKCTLTAENPVAARHILNKDGFVVLKNAFPDNSEWDGLGGRSITVAR